MTVRPASASVTASATVQWMVTSCRLHRRLRTSQLRKQQRDAVTTFDPPRCLIFGFPRIFPDARHKARPTFTGILRRPMVFARVWMTEGRSALLRFQEAFVEEYL